MEENSIKRIQPHDMAAEQAVVGAMLMNRSVIADINDILSKDDFYNVQYGILYDAMISLYNEGKAVEPIIVRDKLRAMKVPDELTDPMFIGRIIAETATSVNAVQHAEIVRDKSTLRQMIKITDDIAKGCYVGSEDTDTILEQAEQAVFKLSQSRNGQEDIVPMSKVVVNFLEEVEEASRNSGRVTGVPTGFIDLDNKLTGLHGGELILVAARPAMGKTAFVLNIAHHVAVKKKIPVAMFSLEMSKEQLASRLIAQDSMVDAQALKTGDLGDDDWDKVVESSENISNAPIYIIDNSGITIAELRSICRKLKQTRDIGLIVIDYLQLMNSNRPVESRQQFISEVSRALKNVARELKVPVIALSQLNRAVDSRPDHKPVLADLRESGAIEQDADVVMFIYRDDYYNPESERPGIAEIIVAKQRSGSTGSIDLVWLGKYTKFENYAK